MANCLKIVWRRLYGRNAKGAAEVEQIAVLQQAAARRRAEYAQEEQAALTATTPPQASSQGSLTLIRKRMEEAEAAYSVALQAWDNKQSRQKSR